MELNTILLGVVTTILLMYGGLARQDLPIWLSRLFQNPLFGVILLTFIAYISTLDYVVALIVAVLYLLIMHQSNQTQVNEYFMSKM